MGYQPKFTVYISGKISGMEKKARRLFKRQQKRLEKKGYRAINPFEIGDSLTIDQSLPEQDKWQKYMRADLIVMLQKADAILLLKNWKDSDGAKFEELVARTCGINIFKEGEL